MISFGKGFSYYYLLLSLLICSGMASSCGLSKNLKTDETFLQKNKIVLKSDKRIRMRDKRALKYELSTIEKQKPNTTKLLQRFRIHAYYNTQAKIQATGDTTKWNRWVMKAFAKPPVIYKKSTARATAQSMQYYLQHKGYNDAIVTDTAIHHYRRKRTDVIYTAVLNNLYKIDSVRFISKDTPILALMNQNKSETLLKKGQAVSKELFDKEHERFIKLLRNNGYAYFNNSFFYAEGDTSKYKVTVDYEILPPPKTEQHTVYRIGNIIVIPDYSPNYVGQLRDTLLNGITFKERSYDIEVKPKNIIRNIFLHTGDLYQEDNFLKTNLQLRSFDIFKKVNIQQVINPEDSTLLDFIIQLSQKKKMVFGADLELNNSNINSTENVSLLGIAGSLNFRHRNLFRNAYVLFGEVQGGVDLNLNAQNSPDLLFSVDLSAKGDLYMPRFIDPIKIWKGLRWGRIIKRKFYQDLKEKGRSRFSASYNRLFIVNSYGYNSFNLSFGYDLQRNANNRYKINHFGINYLATTIESQTFQDLLDENPFLAASFDDQLFTGLLFKDFSYTYVGKTNRYGRSFFFQADVELSGAEVFAANKLYNCIANVQDTFRLFNIDFAQFASLSIDGRYYKTISNSRSFAARFSAGIAQPFGFSAEVPYVKQFYSGGPYSIRAWAIRELGPGQYVYPDTIKENIPFFQTADFKLELNAEYRFDIFWMLESALFLDIGNVWTLGKDAGRPGSQLLWSPQYDSLGNVIGKNFIDQLAVGTGFGIRGDFSYFIIRLDLGFKLRNPYPDPETNKHWRWAELRKGPFNDVNYNLAIGYPF